MRKYKLIFTAFDDYGVLTQYSIVREGVDEDAVCDAFERDEQHAYVGFNGFEDILYITDHPLMSQKVTVNMPDGYTYIVPMSFLINEMAKAQYTACGKSSYEEQVDHYILPIGASNPKYITDWASENIEWKDIAMNSTCVKERTPEDVMIQAWKSLDKNILGVV